MTDRGADLGLALDGDADRVIAVDHTGAIVDGDVLLALFALDLADRGQLAGNTVVVTVMTNLGFRLTMEGRGIAVRETDVGDRHVLAALDADGLSLGGEQSGHIIFRSRSTTGDGTLTGIVLADLMRRSGRSLADLAHGLVVRVPQVLVNVPIPQPGRLTDCVEVWDEVAKAPGHPRDRRPGPPARQRHRAPGPGHGRGPGRGPGQCGGGPAGRFRRGRPGAGRGLSRGEGRERTVTHGPARPARTTRATEAAPVA